MTKHIESEFKLENYNHEWPKIFLTEKTLLQEALGSELQAIYHIGSTSIPALAAKPIIDMILVFDNLDMIQAVDQKLIKLGYAPARKMIIPHRSFITSKKLDHIGYHLHLYERGDPQINRHVNFKEYLIEHPKKAQEYQQLKLTLKEKYHRIHDYLLGKDALVQAIDRKAKLWFSTQTNHFLQPNTGPKASEWSLEKMMTCMEANLNVHMTHFAQYINDVNLTRMPDYTLVNSNLKDDTFNYIIRADFDEQSAHQKIKQATDYFTSRHLPFSWWISPADRPQNLGNLLQKNGYVNTENNIAMYLNLDDWHTNIVMPKELKIVRVQDEKGLRDFALVLSNDPTAFSTYFSWVSQIISQEDPIEFYVGYVNNKPVVRGLTCYYAQVAGLHWLSTCPEERNKGYGTAMQEFRLSRAQELGYHIAVLQASPEGYALYKKLGYQECGTYKEFKLAD